MYFNSDGIIVHFTPYKKGKIYPRLHQEAPTTFKSERAFKRLSHSGWKISPRRIDWSQCISAMHLVCKQLSVEYLGFLYSRVEFHFLSSNWLYKFCTTSRSTSLYHIRKVQLSIATYGQPKYMMDVRYLQKNYNSWSRTISKMIQEMPNIEEVDLSLSVADNPLAFTFREAWAQPFLQLRRLEQLRSAKVTLRSSVIQKNKKQQKQWIDDASLRELAIQQIILEGLHEVFAEAFALRLQGRTEEEATEKYRQWVEMTAENLGLEMLCKAMGVMGVVAFYEAMRFGWVEKN